MREKEVKQLTEEEAKRAKVKVVLELDGEIVSETEGETIVACLIDRDGKDTEYMTLIGPEIESTEAGEAITELMNSAFSLMDNFDFNEDNVVDFKRH